MTSPKQIAANHINAQKSTGPRTPEGKAAVAQNTLKHGLTGLMRLLPDEDQAEYARHCEGIVADLRPTGELELRLAQAIADDYWRIDRIRRLEQTLFLLNSPDELQVTIDHQKQLNLYTLYESRLNRNLRNNHAELRRIQAERKAAQAPAAPVSDTTPTPETNPVRVTDANGFVYSFASVPEMIEAEMASIGCTRLHDVSDYDPANDKKAA
jgi:hypothetical protein